MSFDAVIVVVRVAFILIAVLALLDLGRYRDQTRLDIALMFVSVALIIIQLTANPVPANRWLSIPSSIAVAAQPYLLLRLVQHFHSVPRLIRWLALIGMATSWVILLVIPAPRPLLLTLIAVAYFIYVESYAAYAFVRGALTTRGVTRWRLGFAAAGSGLLALVIAFVVTASLNPTLENLIALASMFLLLLILLSYYFGFAPPRWLRRAWQLAELHQFLREAAGQPADTRAGRALELLCLYSARAVGGLAAVVALWDGARNQLVIRDSAATPALSGTLDINAGMIGRAWNERKPFVASTPAESGADGARLAAAVHAEALLVVPLATAERAWGLLLVFLRRGPLFADDDLNLLALFAEHSTLIFDYATLLNEQQALVEKLQNNAVRLRALDRISQALAEASFETQTVLNLVAHQIAELIGDACVIHLLSIDKQWLDPVAYHHPNPEAVTLMRQMAASSRQRADEGLSGRVVQTGQPVLIPIISQEELRAALKPEHHVFLDRFGTSSVLHTPLQVQGRVIGTLGISRDKPGRPYTDDDRAFLQAVAARAALAIDNAHLFEAAQREIAERKWVQEEINQLYKELERRVAERTAQLEAANHELDAFAHTVAHELKGPLAQIVGFIGVLELDVADKLEGEPALVMSRIVEGTYKLKAIIDGLLLLARTRHTEVKIEPLDMAQIFLASRQRLAPQIETYQAQIKPFAIWPMASGYSPWIEEVWVNYLSNALKYGGPQPYIEAGWDERNGALRFWVRDHGPGIAPEDQQKLFAPFVRLGGVHEPGHGLGLSIVRQIVEKCGGQVGVESEGVAGKGSTFWFTLPGVPYGQS